MSAEHRTLAAGVHLVGDDRDPLAALARHLFSTTPASADLSGTVILLPDARVASRARAALLDAASTCGIEALLGPQITTLRRWIARNAPPERPVLGEDGRRLMLVEALAEHRGLFGDSNPWTVADSLVELFDQLTRGARELPADYAAFAARIARAYGAGDAQIAGLSQEARLVHTLWRAWHTQQRAEGVIDAEAAYVAQLAASARELHDSHHFHLIGHARLAPAELAWARHMLAHGRLNVWLNGSLALSDDELHTDAPARAMLRGLGIEAPDVRASSPYDQFLDAVYAPFDERAPAALQRARAFAATHAADPAKDRLRVAAAADAELEALTVDLQVRRWLLEGHQSIAVVTEDRLLARRLRALLERADIMVEDAGGWALSTTRAAAALERWLEAVEEDFPYLALADLLRSAFVLPTWDRETLQNALYRLEQDIILHENVARGIARYRRHLDYRAARLGWEGGGAVRELLEALEHAAKPLVAFTRGANAHDPARLLEALQESLVRLGLDEGYRADTAGALILDVLERLRVSLARRRLRMTWNEFRAWLGQALERTPFHLPGGDGRVQLLGLEQSALGRYDALVIAGADAGHLPGAGSASPFFNEAVRRELGLSGSRENLAHRFHLFRRLLSAAPRVLITWRREQDGEEILPSPWVELLTTFHRWAYHASLQDEELLALATRADAHVRRSDAQELPEPVFAPAPRLHDPALLPDAISANAYQQLVNCPYQFYAARCLGLAPPDAIRERLEKSDYGERVHRVLQAFHSDVQGLPGPAPVPLTPDKRADAIDLLTRISLAVFAKDLEDNFEHRGWLVRWQAVIPVYVEWEIVRARTWRPAAVEVKKERLCDGFKLTGRLDRLDRGADGTAIIDYKTGYAPEHEDVAMGEAVQLPYYALLLDEMPARIEYVPLERNGVGSRWALEGDELALLARAIERRLIDLVGEMRAGAALPAWGDEETCSRCNVSGVCRRAVWSVQDA